MRGRIASGMVLWVGALALGTTALGQDVVRERDTTITGPRGRTIQRDVRSERGPGYIDRRVQIQRPGGTLTREVQVRGGGPGFVGGGYVPGPSRTFVERDVIINRPAYWGPTFAVGTPFAFGLGLPFFNFNFGAVAPPPVYVPPAPVIIAQPPVVVPPPQVVVPDAFSDAIGRLRSLHEHSRRDGALTLGRMRDPRAVPALLDRLKNDTSREVRTAAAWSLGEIGDPRAGVGLQRAALFDWRQEVRDAASRAYARLPQPGQEPAMAPPGQPTGAVGPPPTIAVRPSTSSSDVPPPPPEPVPPAPPTQPSQSPFANPSASARPSS
ncbi:MAG TPA: HEAT repeat domain-containing protein [Isosphaeraceae bacterium]|nr:HEAT repeat domain-containing protein [Isosphaeraceae bacterium]